MNRPVVQSVVLTTIIAVVLTLGFGFVYFNDHAWGAWGDDSAGYIYLAGRMWQQQPLVYTDNLARAGFDFFADEKLTRWLTPTHHALINTQGVVASKYPIGLSLLMLLFAKIIGSSHGFYSVVPLLGAVNIGLIYVLGVAIFAKERWRHAVGFLAAVGVGLSNLYYDHAIAQPMRELPSITFLLLMALAVVGAWRTRQRWQQLTLFAVAGAMFGVAFLIRETSAVVLPGAVVASILALWPTLGRGKQRLQRLGWPVVVFAIAAAVALIPLVKNSAAISAHKEVFKARDTSTTVLLPNIGHVNTLSIDNVFNSEGKFRPNTGSLPHYWDVLQQASPLLFFLALALLGLIGWWRQDRAGTALLTLWFFGTLIIFSLWINPYSRYILPLFPPLFLLASYGLVRLLRDIVPQLLAGRMARYGLTAVVLLTVGLSYGTIATGLWTNLHTDVYRFKAISAGDLTTLETLGTDLIATQDNPVLMFSGSWQYGTSETLEAHTGLKTIRFPIEQRVEFAEGTVDQFFTEQVLPTYSLLMWVDATSSPQALEFLNAHPHQLVGTYDFTFQPGVQVYTIAK